MSQSLASFRELKGIGPATEARLHETGVYTWEALATAAAALAAVRGNGDTLRELAGAVAARTEVGGTESRPPSDGERLEAFVLRVSLSANGEAQRSEVTHVRTMAEQAWAGWHPTELSGFIQKHAKLRPERTSREKASPEAVPPRPARRQDAPSREAATRDQAPSREPASASSVPASTEQVVVLDAGKAIGGPSRDVNLVVTNTRSAGAAFGYLATLEARGLGRGENGEGWTTLATRHGAGSADGELALGFPGVQLPPGIHRLQLRLEVQLPEPVERPPALSLA